MLNTVLLFLVPKEVTDDQVVQPLKPLMRVATEEDAAVCASNEEKEKEAFQICLEKIKKHGLEMKLIDSEYTFDRNKLLFYFTADGRIDFRELVKDLASVFHTRIELRQIGVRDETKMLGGIAICGRPLCCHSYLSDFVPVSIKMAKEQNLSLNPAKISGVCGRLMCCLKNEQEAYEYLNRSLPNIGTKTTTPEGYPGEVQSVSVLRQLVKVVFTNDNGEKEVREYPVAELQFDQKKNFGKNIPQQILPDEKLDEEELIALEELSQEEELIDEEDKPEQAKRNRNNRSNKSVDVVPVTAVTNIQTTVNVAATILANVTAIAIAITAAAITANLIIVTTIITAAAAIVTITVVTKIITIIAVTSMVAMIVHANITTVNHAENQENTKMQNKDCLLREGERLDDLQCQRITNNTASR